MIMRGLYILLLGFTVVFPACTPFKVSYLEEVTRKATQEDIIQKWGPPTESHDLESGESAWGYRFKSFSSMASRVVCEGYDLLFDANRVLTKWNSVYC